VIARPSGVAGATAVAVLLTAAPRPARATDRDPWFGPDKKLHFEISAALAAGGYAAGALLAQLSTNPERASDRRIRFAVGAAVALGAGVSKELWDLSGHGDASFRDLTWDLIGTATGLAIAGAVDWTITALTRRRGPVAVTQP
jgi:putative lipoprotein